MTHVYVVIVELGAGPGEGRRERTILGVFSDFEKARAFIENRAKDEAKTMCDMFGGPKVESWRVQ